MSDVIWSPGFSLHFSMHFIPLFADQNYSLFRQKCSIKFCLAFQAWTEGVIKLPCLFIGLF